jgi:hypothetical protein
MTEYFEVETDLQAPPAAFVYGIGLAQISGKLRKAILGPGLSLVGHPFARGSSTVRELAPAVPEGTTLFFFNNATHNYEVNIYDFGQWQQFDQVFSPGQGAFILNTGTIPVELGFLGEEGPPEKLVRPVTEPMFFLVSCGAAQSCRVEDFLPGPLIDGDTAYRFSGGQWQVSVRDQGAWVGFDPVMNQGEALFLRLMPSP